VRLRIPKIGGQVRDDLVGEPGDRIEMRVGLVAVEVRIAAKSIADGNLRNVQSATGGQREAFTDIERVQRIEAVIGISRSGGYGTNADTAERTHDLTGAGDDGTGRDRQVRIDYAERTVGTEIDRTAIDARADDQMVPMVE